MAVVVACLIAPRAADSCGGDLEAILFTSYHHAFPGELETGRIGVLRSHYYRRDLLLAYRVISGVPLPTGETANQKPEFAPASNRAEPWLVARREITAVPVPASIDPDKRLRGSDYQSFANCLADAFTTAAATLRKRVAQWGAQSSNVAEWVRGQDQVFQNCSAGPTIPEELKSGDPLLVADRNYQIAAAEFYAGKWTEAEADFDEIANDSASPWHDIAPYLAARTCIRHGTIESDGSQLGLAAQRIQEILDNPARRDWHSRAQGLLDFVRAQTEPDQRLEELGKQLLQADPGVKLQRVVTDYTTIWDRIEEQKQDPQAEESDVTDWILTFQKSSPAIEKWRSKRTAPWLIAALASAGGADPAPADLIAAAHKIPPGSPAWASVAYYGIRQQIRAGQLDAARQWADEVLAAKPPESALSVFRAERMMVARNWTEFLRYAPRTPVAVGSEGWEEPLSDTGFFKKRPPAFDADATFALNKAVPLTLWVEASRSELLPANLQAEVASAGWMRAVILDDRTIAKNLAGRLGQLKPELAAAMRGYVVESDPAMAKFIAVFFILQHPQFLPVARYGDGRIAPHVWNTSDFADWWSLEGSAPKDRDHEALVDLYSFGDLGPKGFLTPEQRAAGQKEWARLLQRAGGVVNFPCSETIAWAGSHPRDQRVPEALHACVKPWTYGPGPRPGDADGLSKQAFDILHRRYPASEWTKKTKYWY